MHLVSHLWEDSYHEEVWISLRTMSLIKTELILQPLYVWRQIHYLEH